MKAGDIADIITWLEPKIRLVDSLFQQSDHDYQATVERTGKRPWQHCVDDPSLMHVTVECWQQTRRQASDARFWCAVSAFLNILVGGAVIAAVCWR